MSAFLLILGCYLLGSFPTAYLAGRLVKGIDIRRYGSGSVSGSNVLRTVGRWAVVPVVVVDVGKGVGAVLLARALGLDLGAQGLAGLASVAGHNWSAFLRLSGGRGIGTSLGVVLLLGPRELVPLAAVAAVGWAVRQTPLGFAVAVPTVPLASWLLGEPVELTLTGVGIVVLVMGKRLLSNPGTGVPGLDWREVAVNRLLFDRDIRDRETWIRRRSAVNSLNGVAH